MTTAKTNYENAQRAVDAAQEVLMCEAMACVELGEVSRFLVERIKRAKETMDARDEAMKAWVDEVNNTRKGQ